MDHDDFGDSTKILRLAQRVQGYVNPFKKTSKGFIRKIIEKTQKEFRVLREESNDVLTHIEALWRKPQNFSLTKSPRWKMVLGLFHSFSIDPKMIQKLQISPKKEYLNNLDFGIEGIEFLSMKDPN